ncbi:bacteriophage lysis protein [Providencia rustigianii]
MMSSNRHALLAYIAVGLVSGSMVFGATRLIYQSKLDATVLGHQMALNAISAQAFMDASDKLAQLQEAQSKLHQLDVTYNQRLSDEQNVSQSLRDDLLTERRRVRFASTDLATCKLAISSATSTSSVGDVASVGLTRKGGLIVHDIRTGIQQDRAKITYLQNYIVDIVNQCKVAK